MYIAAFMYELSPMNIIIKKAIEDKFSIINVELAKLTKTLLKNNLTLLSFLLGFSKSCLTKKTREDLSYEWL